MNGRRVNIASYLVKDNDVIELTAKAKEMARVIEVDPVRPSATCRNTSMSTTRT